ncbi:protein kinase domain-containing protein [Haliangium sp.]|uniref:protein kinase domain-containing protein n=1 Tax=Haliangium sp. TaxID=2663208 RepID=UPI003D09D15A
MSTSDSTAPPPPEDLALPEPEDRRDPADPRFATDRLDQIIDGRYRILEVIGRGGMGSVYKAEHIAIHRVVALKLLHPSLAQVPEVSRRFEREAFAIGRIEHPNCVNVTDFGRLPDGSLYLAMEYLEGHPLSDELSRKRRVSPERTLHILRHILRGLGHAHRHDIVHRDVKPENVVLVEHDGDPDFAKILDFGIAKLIGNAAQDDGGDTLTQAGMAFGTPIYMSPEQALGEPIDGRADLYAATVMAFEMITGKPPFHSDDKIEVMSMHATRAMPTLAEISPGLVLARSVERALERLFRRGLAKRPQDRYPDANTYIAAIDEALAEITGDAPELVLTAPNPAGADPSARGDTVSSSPSEPPTGAAALTEGSSEDSSADPAQAPRHPPWQPAAVSLPTVPRRAGQRATLYAAVAVAAVLSVVVIVALTSSRVGGSESVGQVQLDAGPPGTAELVTEVASLLARGAPEEAVALFEEHPEALTEDPGAQLLLGHAHAALRANSKAIEAYGRALERDPTLAADPVLRTNLQGMFDDRGTLASVDAAALLYDKLGVVEAGDHLIELASKARGLRIRTRAVEATEALELDERVDWVGSLLLDLHQLRRCGARKEVVARLRAIGDARAIEALSQASRRRKNRCLRADAHEAIEYLERLNAEIDAGVQP